MITVNGKRNECYTSTRYWDGRHGFYSYFRATVGTVTYYLVNTDKAQDAFRQATGLNPDDLEWTRVNI